VWLDGLYATDIGASNAVPGALSLVLTNTEVFLEIMVGGTTLSPRERIVSVAYALVAAGVSDGGISSSMLADDAVTSAKIADGSISNLDLSPGAVTGSSILDGSLTGFDVADGSISNTDVAANTFWETDGNTGTVAGTHFVGTTDEQPLELHIHGERIAEFRKRIPSSEPIVLLGWRENSIDGVSDGSTISGGGSSFPGSHNAISNGSYDTINRRGGGEKQNPRPGQFRDRGRSRTHHGRLSLFHYRRREWKFDPGGFRKRGDCGRLCDTHQHQFHWLCGRRWLAAIGLKSKYSFIGGGFDNRIKDDAECAIIVNGQANDVFSGSRYGVIGGDWNNNVGTDSSYSIIASGRNNDIGSNSTYAVVGGGLDNDVAADSSSATIGGGVFNDIGSG